MSLDPDLLVRAHERGGLFTAAEAYAAGTSPKMLNRAVRDGRCRPVLRGVYSCTLPPPRYEDQLHELTVAMLLTNDRVAATGRSAAVLLDLPLFGVDLQRAQGVWCNDNATRSTRDVIIRRPLVPVQVQEVDGWPVAETPWALIDLARDAGVVPGVVAMDAALHAGLTDRAAVVSAVAELRASHRLGRARQMIDLANGKRESAGESRLGLMLGGAGFDLETQFSVRRFWSGRRAFADFRVRGTRVLIEFDGLVKYRGDEGPEVLAQEKAREDELRRQGWVFVRVIWSELANPRAIIARVYAAIDLAARVPSRV